MYDTYKHFGGRKGMHDFKGLLLNPLNKRIKMDYAIFYWSARASPKKKNMDTSLLLDKAIARALALRALEEDIICDIAKRGISGK